MTAPDTFDLRAAARAVVAAHDSGLHGAVLAEGAASIWSALVGLPDDDAVTYARELAAGPPATAHVPPM